MQHDSTAWTLACDLARSGQFANVIMIERELQRQGLIRGELTGNQYKRSLLTRTCHAMRGSDLDTRLMSVLGLSSAAPGAGSAAR